MSQGLRKKQKAPGHNSSALLSHEDNLCVRVDSVQSSAELKATTRLSQSLHSFLVVLSEADAVGALTIVPLPSLEFPGSLFLPKSAISCISTNEEAIDGHIVQLQWADLSIFHTSFRRSPGGLNPCGHQGCLSSADLPPRSTPWLCHLEPLLN